MTLTSNKVLILTETDLCCHYWHIGSLFHLRPIKWPCFLPDSVFPRSSPAFCPPDPRILALSTSWLGLLTRGIYSVVYFL